MMGWLKNINLYVWRHKCMLFLPKNTRHPSRDGIVTTTIAQKDLERMMIKTRLGFVNVWKEARDVRIR